MHPFKRHADPAQERRHLGGAVYDGFGISEFWASKKNTMSAKHVGRAQDGRAASVGVSVLLTASNVNGIEPVQSTVNSDKQPSLISQHTVRPDAGLVGPLKCFQRHGVTNFNDFQVRRISLQTITEPRHSCISGSSRLRLTLVQVIIL